MESIRKYYIPNACISFTILVLFQSAVNALRGRDGAGFGRFCLEVGLCILLVCAVDFIVERFSFRSVRGMLAGKYIAECAAMLLFGFLFGLKRERRAFWSRFCCFHVCLPPLITVCTA